MPSFDEILKDAQNFPDNLNIRIGEHEVPLGSVRQLTATERKQFETKVAQIAETEREAQKRLANANDLASKAEQALKTATEAAAGMNRPAPSADADPFTDPWLAPVKKALEERDKRLADVQAKLDAELKSKQQIATIWAEDRWDREFSSLNFGNRPADQRPSRDALLKHSVDNKLFDRHGMPSVTKAWEDMSRGDREAEVQRSAYEKGLQEGRQREMAARVLPPGVPGSAPIGKSAPTGELPDLYAEAVKDPELRPLMEQLASVGIQ